MKSEQWLSDLDSRLADQMRFLLMADRLKSVDRGSRIADGSRRENTAEHSWHLALFAVVLREWAVGPVELSRVIEMLILHDLIEIECGDTPLFDAAGSATQAARERAAADQIFGVLPPDQRATLRSLWEEFESAETPDAKFAKALDRLQPILLNHAVGGGTWTHYNVDETRERLMTGRIAEGAPALWDAAQAVFKDAVIKGW